MASGTGTGHVVFWVDAWCDRSGAQQRAHGTCHARHAAQLWSVEQLPHTCMWPLVQRLRWRRTLRSSSGASPTAKYSARYLRPRRRERGMQHNDAHNSRCEQGAQRPLPAGAPEPAAVLPGRAHTPAPEACGLELHAQSIVLGDAISREPPNPTQGLGADAEVGSCEKRSRRNEASIGACGGRHPRSQRMMAPACPGRSSSLKHPCEGNLPVQAM